MLLGNAMPEDHCSALSVKNNLFFPMTVSLNYIRCKTGSYITFRLDQKQGYRDLYLTNSLCPIWFARTNENKVKLDRICINFQGKNECRGIMGAKHNHVIYVGICKAYSAINQVIKCYYSCALTPVWPYYLSLSETVCEHPQ